VQPFVLNRHGRLVFPSNFLPDLDFSVIGSESQLDGVIRRDFETKAPTGTDILNRIEAGAYSSRFELLRDVALNLFWVNRFAFTMYEKQPMRWRDVPRRRDDVFLPIVAPWIDADIKVSAVARAYQELPTTWNSESEDRIFNELFEVFGHRTHDATDLPSIKPTIAEASARPESMTFTLLDFDPDHPTHSYEEILDVSDDVPELESLRRWAMVLRNQYPWDHRSVRLKPVGEMADDDVVVLFRPRNREVLRFIGKVKSQQANGGTPPAAKSFGAAAVPEADPASPYPALDVPHRFRIQPRIAALAVVKGEFICTNDDLIRNSAYSWSPMSAQEITHKTGIEERRYTALELEEISLLAARSAMEHAGVGAADIGAVLFCSCTSARTMPSVATWLSGQLGLHQTHASVDLIAACAGLPYGLSEATRILQEVNRPVLLVCGEKFSDKIGTVRPSRMIFGDGAAALVLVPAAEGEAGDISLLQTYASGPVSQVNSIIWPNPAFDNNITVFGPEVKTMAGRYLEQMIGELQALPDTTGRAETAWGTVELVVPHQANKTMIINLAAAAGLSADRLYFNIEKMGNTSSASIPIAIADAVAEGVIDRPMWIFAPGFGAGAVAGYSVMRIDPAVVAIDAAGTVTRHAAGAAEPDPNQRETSASDDIAVAFGV
jgi:3-oxoacyl-[acyl-carrier-protein] synthase-3